MIKTENFIQVSIASAEELRAWLIKNYAQEESVWLVTYKKSAPDKYVSTSQVLDELICFGWIDGIRRKLNAEQTMQLISRRKVQHWSGTYKQRAAKLMEEGRMMGPGYDSIEKGKASGLWNFMDDVDQLIVPPDLAAALDQQAGAAAFFQAINDSSKRFALRWLKLAKTKATRSKRIAQLVQLSASGEKLKGS